MANCEVAGCNNQAARRLKSEKPTITTEYEFCHDHAEEQKAKFSDLEVVGDA